MFCHGRRRRCHVLSWSAAPPAPSLSVRIPHAAPPSRSVRPAGGRDPVSRVSRAPARPSARVCAGAVCAPDCARAAGRTSSVMTGRLCPSPLVMPGTPPGLACLREGGGIRGPGHGSAGCVMECHASSCFACFPVLFSGRRSSLPLPFRSSRRGGPGCHEMSCFVMVAAGNVMFCHVPPGLRSRRRLSVSRMLFLHRVPFRPVPFAPPPARPAGGTLFRAYRARARSPVSARLRRRGSRA